MDELNVVVTLLLFAGLFLNWSKAVISAAIAIIIRNRALSSCCRADRRRARRSVWLAARAVRPSTQPTGWQAIDALTVITVVLGVGSLLWWIVARALYALGTTRHSWARRRAIGSQHRK